MAFNPNAMTDAEYAAYANQYAAQSPLDMIANGAGLYNLSPEQLDALNGYIAANGRVRMRDPWEYYQPSYNQPAPRQAPQPAQFTGQPWYDLPLYAQPNYPALAIDYENPAPTAPSLADTAWYNFPAYAPPEYTSARTPIFTGYIPDALAFYNNWEPDDYYLP